MTNKLGRRRDVACYRVSFKADIVDDWNIFDMLRLSVYISACREVVKPTRKSTSHIAEDLEGRVSVTDMACTLETQYKVPVDSGSVVEIRYLTKEYLRAGLDSAGGMKDNAVARSNPTRDLRPRKTQSVRSYDCHERPKRIHGESLPHPSAWLIERECKAVLRPCTI
jgi:hypothetical protein